MTLSSDGKFRTLNLSKRVVIIESLGQDWYGWGNYQEDIHGNLLPSFIAYLGCDSESSALTAKETVESVCGGEVEIRSRRSNQTGFLIELKIRGLSRQALDDLVSIGDRLQDYFLYAV